jgi:hypothetical protein
MRPLLLVSAGFSVNINTPPVTSGTFYFFFSSTQKRGCGGEKEIKTDKEHIRKETSSTRVLGERKKQALCHPDPLSIINLTNFLSAKYTRSLRCSKYQWSLWCQCCHCGRCEETKVLI